MSSRTSSSYSLSSSGGNLSGQQRTTIGSILSAATALGNNNGSSGDSKKKFISKYQHTRHNIKETNKQNNLEELQKKKMSLEVLQSGFKKMSNMKSNMYNQMVHELDEDDLYSTYKPQVPTKQPPSLPTSSNNSSNSSPQKPNNRERSRKFLESLEILKNKLPNNAKQQTAQSPATNLSNISNISDDEEDEYEHMEPLDNSHNGSSSDFDEDDADLEKELEQEIASLDEQIYGAGIDLRGSNSFSKHIDNSYNSFNFDEPERQVNLIPEKTITITPHKELDNSLSKDEIELSKLDRLKELIEYRKELDRREALIDKLVFGLKKETQIHQYKLREMEKFCKGRL